MVATATSAKKEDIKVEEDDTKRSSDIKVEDDTKKSSAIKIEDHKEDEGNATGSTTNTTTNVQEQKDDFETLYANAYNHYKKMKAADLKNILTCNGVITSGKKDVLLTRIIDGHVHGRLRNCDFCKGRLKVAESGKNVVCPGSYEEGFGHVQCAFVSPLHKKSIRYVHVYHLLASNAYYSSTS